MAKRQMPLYFKDEAEQDRYRKLWEAKYSNMPFYGMFIQMAKKELDKFERTAKGEM